MASITDVDKNFKVETKIEAEGLKFFDPLTEPFSVHGVFYEDGKYRRLPENVAKSVSEGVYHLHSQTSGGRVRFKTDSPYIAINVEYDVVGKMPHFALTGSAGFDLYERVDGREYYYKTFVVPFDVENGYESLIGVGTDEPVLDYEISEMREWTINFPLYSGVKKLYIGLHEDSRIEKAAPYENEKPVVFYGSSITQGGCASRPGTMYPAIVARSFNLDYINLGFSGSAKAEDEMIEYIKGLSMSIFVYDYDHNAPTPEYLSKTHEKMFRAIREAHPDLPILMMTNPKYFAVPTSLERQLIVRKTYENAVASGDKNVYFLDAKALMELCGNAGTVDDCHPTDLGFFSMAEAVIKVFEEIFRRKEK